MKGFLEMKGFNEVDLREIFFDYHLRLAKEGYKEDAIDALRILDSYIEDAPNIPPIVKEYFSVEVSKLIVEKEKNNTPHAFYLKRKGSKPPKKRELINRNIDWAKQVHERRYYEYKDGVYHKREKPLCAKGVAEEIAIEMDGEGTKDRTILNAYNEYKGGLEEG